eukprot:TRINITY_DN16278_c1_g1_i1.p1 TRINITY_DN16278_c1_g1~~TRINITY_DN16278_c1_g1_i1.p1  ORF type:complete len:216 (+),score=40.83 TRINITY_DN16278_c1_g1_i1:763-1410(+)
MSSWFSSLGISSMMKRSKSDAGLTMTPMGPRHPIVQATPSFDLDSVPEVDGESEILRMEEIFFLSNNFPARILGADWKLTYSTSSHGFSLANVYRKFQDARSPTLIAVLDTNDQLFGALISENIKMDEHFYGTGESFLFSLRPKKNIFSWSGENQLFVQGTLDSLIVGAGDGHFGLFIDSNIYKGRTQACATYNNQPLASQEDFVIKTLECWTFS